MPYDLSHFITNSITDSVKSDHIGKFDNTMADSLNMGSQSLYHFTR